MLRLPQDAATCEHSFFLPNMRVKQDAVPGRTIPVWFRRPSRRSSGEWKNGKWEYAHGRQGQDQA